jgi:uncharacterized repeat protein (TIGR01451 family)
MKINPLLAFILVLAQSISPAQPGRAGMDEPDSPAAIAAPVLKWVHGGCDGSSCETGWYSSPAVADLDKDGYPEVIGASYSLYLINGLTGATKLTLDPTNNRIWPDVVVADLQPDGDLEIVTGNGAGDLAVYNHQGVSLWRTKTITASELRSLAVADLDGNGSLEIIVASTSSSNQWSVYRANGTMYPSSWPQHSPSAPGYAAGCYNENIAAGDLDGDGRGEIIGPNDTHYIDAFNDDGSQISANSMFGANKLWSQVGVHVDQAVDIRGYANCGVEHRPNFADSAPIIADLDGNGTPETVVIGNVYNCGTNPYTDLYQMPFIFNVDRSRWTGSGFDWTVIPTPDSKAAPKSEDWHKIETDEPNPVAADIDGDGHKEILFSSYDGRVHAYWLDKTEHGSWPYSVYQQSEGFIRFATEPVVADLDGNGKAEVIFASWTQKGSNHTGKLYILDYLGNPVQIVDLPFGSGSTWDGALAAPTLADIDGDNQLEVVLNTANSGLVAYDLPGSRTDGILWGTGRGSYQRNGLAMGSLANSQAIVTPAGPLPGSTLNYTIRLRNPGLPLDTVTLTDTLSAGQTYSGGLNASSGTAYQNLGVIYWNGNVGSAPVTITFNTVVNPSITDTRLITSTVLINDKKNALVRRNTLAIVNGKILYVPFINK